MDLSRTPGGSSGGSGAALAAGLTGARGRQRHRRLDPQPRALLRRVRPQADVRRGLAARPCTAGNVAQADISVCGPLARGAEDLEIAMDVMAGPDEIDGRGWTLPCRARRRRRCASSRSRSCSDPNCEVDQSVQAELQKLASFLGKQKAKVSDTRAAGDRHGRAERRLCPPAARGDLGPHDRRGMSEAARDAAALPNSWT